MLSARWGGGQPDPTGLCRLLQEKSKAPGNMKKENDPLEEDGFKQHQAGNLRGMAL